MRLVSATITLVLILIARAPFLQAQAIHPIEKDVTVSGVLNPAGSIHYYRFSARGGEVVKIETFAERLSPRSPLDTVVSVLSNDRQRVLAVNDDIDLTIQSDSILCFVVPVTDNYIIKLESFESFIGSEQVGGPTFRYDLRWTTPSNNRLLDFPQIADGDVITSTIVLLNHSATAASGSINLFLDDGTAYVTMLEGQLSSSFRFSLPPGGTLRMETQGAADLKAGWAQVIADNPNLAGNIIFFARAFGRIFVEAGVGASQRTNSFSVFTDSIGSAITGIALANPGTETTTVTLTLRSKNGAIVGSPQTQTFAPGTHTALFTHELFSDVSDILEFEGTVTGVTDRGQVVVTALRFDNPDFSAYTTVPVLSGGGSTAIYFPQVANGGNYFKTALIMLNSSSSEATGELRLFKSDGSPFELPLSDGRRGSRFEIRIPPHGALRLESSGTGELQSGWAVVTTNTPIAGNAIYQTFAGSRIISEAGVATSRLYRRFAIFVDSIGPAMTGLAVANTSDRSINLSIRLFNRNGVSVTPQPVRIALGPNGHMARFLDQIFDSFGGIIEFEGSAVIEADEEVSAVSLRFDNEDLSAFTSFPVVP